MLLGDYADLMMKHLPFFFERCVVTMLHCILRDIASSNMTATSHPSSSSTSNDQAKYPRTAFSCSSTFWNMIRLLRELPSETLVQLSGVLGAGLLAAVK